MQFNDKKVWKPLKTQGFHFCHLNGNSLLSKIDELRDIKNYVKAATLGSKESKRDSPVTNAKVNIKGYGMIMNEKTQTLEALHVILEMICVLIPRIFFQIKNIFSNFVKHVFFKILMPKFKPIAVGIFYRPPNANDFLNTFSNDFQHYDSKTNEIYFIRDFNIN